MGLIGGSFALALRDHGLASEILGVENSEQHAAEALRLGLADRLVGFEEGLAEADPIGLATPVATTPPLAGQAPTPVTGHPGVVQPARPPTQP